MRVIAKFAPLLLAAALAVVVAVPASGATAGSGPAELLPDLDQEAPADLRVSNAGPGEWQLGFASTVRNEGAGPLRIDSHEPVSGPGCATICMSADQVVSLEGAGTITYPGIGSTDWTPGGGHDHWHFQELEHYLLRPVSAPDTAVRDEKTGFCLVDAFDVDRCALNDPDRQSLSMGLNPGGSDVYGPFLEGQYITLTKATVPTGRYYLEHRANPNGAIREETADNNSASLLLNVAWANSDSVAPRVQVVRACSDTADCPPQPGDPQPTPPPEPGPGQQPPPQPQPQLQPDNPQPQQPAESGPLPQDVPVGPRPPLIVSGPSARMTRAAAVDLARKGIGRTTRSKAAQIRTACGRASISRYVCRVTWLQRGRRWRGQSSVWYRVVGGQVRWYYKLDATGPGGARLTRRPARGAVSFAAAAPGGALMLCGIPADL